MSRPPSRSTLFPSRRSSDLAAVDLVRYRQEANYTAALLNQLEGTAYQGEHGSVVFQSTVFDDRGRRSAENRFRSEEHTSELQSHSDLVCRLLLEKKNSQSAK